MAKWNSTIAGEGFRNEPPPRTIVWPDPGRAKTLTPVGEGLATVETEKGTTFVVAVCGHMTVERDGVRVCRFGCEGSE